MIKGLTLLFVLALLLPCGKGRAATTANETTEVVPELTYRQAHLKIREKSVYHKETHRDFADQLYLSLKLVRTYDYRHEIVLEPVIRTKRNVPGKIDNEHFIDQAYLKTSLSSFDLTAGKKAEFEGSGYFVNPSDLLNEEKDLFDPLYQKEGMVFSRLRWKYEDFSLAVGHIPAQRQNLRYGKFWAQMAADLVGIDTRLQYTYNFLDLSTFGLSLARFFGDHFEFHYDGRYQQHQRVDRQRELAYSENYGKEDASAYHVGGARIVLTPKRTVVLEAIQNQSGLLPEEAENFYLAEKEEVAKNDIEPLTRLVSRQYAFFAFHDEDTLKKLAFNFSTLHNVRDKSNFTSVELKYTLSPITSVGVAPTFYRGEKLSEFGEAPFSDVTYIVFKGRF